ncbi:hypothetical protein [Bradyrhizobium australiense]|uniref:Uncharacterized protein n=1 Tax=Bradyrhizobium australiense TaxID=2721161 RepID=A0A7Y4GVP3_9BRAD|nr:hypothetical protein [Bradyrhizobium australiense]NOJ42834.1 hypothetical protein [Bradyrhizobium australiense]
MIPKLPGLGPLAALLLAAALSAWLGIAGPISIEGLYRWQNLLAAFAALAAAAIAYTAAMAKVKLDRQISDEQLMRRSLAILLKVEFAIQVLRQEARELEEKLGDWKNKSFKTVDLAISEPKEILEAWETLDLFPGDLILALRTLRASLVLYRTDLAKFDSQVEWESTTLASIKANPTSRASVAAKLLIQQSTDTITALRATITRLTNLLNRA